MINTKHFQIGSGIGRLSFCVEEIHIGNCLVDFWEEEGVHIGISTELEKIADRCRSW